MSGCALVTGASGLVGGAVARALVKQGARVRALVRTSAPLEGLQEGAVELARGDVTDPASVAEAVRGCDRVFHVAGLYSLHDSYERYAAVNVLGTRHVLAAAMAAGVRRVVVTSSTAAIGAEPSGRLADEDTPWNLFQPALPYTVSKLVQEHEAWRWAARGLDVVCVNPSGPIGWGDVKPTPTGNLILSLLRGMLPAAPRSFQNFIDVDDVAQGHLLAMEKGRRGERYLLTNWNTTLHEFAGEVARIAGVRAPVAVPQWISAISGTLIGASYRLLGKVPPVTGVAARAGATPMRFSNRKAVEELGLSITPIEQSIEKAIRYFIARGMCRAPRAFPAASGGSGAPRTPG